MDITAELAKYGTTGIAVAQLILLYWVIRTNSTNLKDQSERHDNREERLNATIDRNTTALEGLKEICAGVREIMRKCDRGS